MPSTSLLPRVHRVLLLLSLALGFTGVPARLSAQATTPTGGIAGRVLNPANGQYVEGARITVAGTPLETFTDNGGAFRFEGVPAGEARVRVFYTGTAPHLDTVRVTAGQTVQLDVTLAASTDRPTSAAGEVVKLDQFTVTTSREMDGAAIAINEQRFAANIKNVVSTDEFGAVAEGNVAEFLKFMPGVTIDLSGGDGRTISLDGAPAANTPITLGGIGLPAPGNNNTSRAVEVGFFNLNNISRIEVSHSPTPDSPGSALSGSINLVPRSSFERARPAFSGSVYFLLRDDERDFGPTPSLYRDRRSTVHPGADFSWIVPVNKRFGFSLSAGASTQFSNQIGHTNTWRGSSVATNGAAFPNTVPGRPYLSAYTLTNAPKETSRNSFGGTLDFRLSAADRIALSFQYSSFDGWTAARSLQFNPNQIVAASVSPTSAQGVAGAGTLVLTSGNGRVRANRTYLPTFTWRHDGPVWKFDSAIGRGYGTNAYRDTDKGQLLSVATRRTNVTIGFEGTGALRPDTITVVDPTTGARVDPFRLDSYALNTIASNPRFASDINFTATANARREFLWRVPVTLRSGLDFRQTARDNTAVNYTYTFAGTDGRGSLTNGTAAPFLDPVASLRPGPYGLPAMQAPDYKGTLDFFRANPTQFTLDQNNLYRSGVNNSKHTVEAVSAAYLRTDVALLDRRLLLVGGVRFEQTNIDAQGPLTDPTLNVQRDSAGRPLRTPAGAVIPITTDALAASKLTLLERGAVVKKEYLRSFPSLNVSYNLRENLIARAAVSTSIGPPDFNQYAGGVTLPSTDNLPSPGNRIVVNNAAIKPWTATSLKVRLEYYFEGVGQISLGAYRRDFQNFFTSSVFLPSPDFLTLYGLDAAEFGAYEVSTQNNLSETVRMEGIDLSYRQALTFLPRWARGLQVFANGSLQKTKAPAGQLGSLAFNEIPRSAAWGVSLTRAKFNVRLNWSYRTDQNRGAVTGLGIEPDTYNYTPGFTKMDILGEYSLSRRFALFANLKNITDVPDAGITVGPNTPAHARLRFQERYGSLWTLGLKGTF